jgi:hypothetical protein
MAIVRPQKAEKKVGKTVWKQRLAFLGSRGECKLLHTFPAKCISTGCSLSKTGMGFRFLAKSRSLYVSGLTLARRGVVSHPHWMEAQLHHQGAELVK